LNIGTARCITRFGVVRRAVKKQTFIILLLLITLASLAAAWFWALPPLLTPLFYMHPTDWTDADLVRHLWHFRLVQPEWVSTPPDYLRWALAETLARLLVIFVIWLTAVIFLERRYLSGHSNTPPNDGAATNRRPPFSGSVTIPALDLPPRRREVRRGVSPPIERDWQEKSVCVTN